jgi:quercetin dioxygenase-like cupin family protein
MTAVEPTVPSAFTGVHQYRLDDMRGGWFVGNFGPTSLHSSAAEVAVKRYRAGEVEAAHSHRLGTEVTLIVEGSAVMCGRELGSGDILVLEPGTVTGFRAITEVTTVVVKTPSIPGDKYPAADETIGR